MNKTSLLIITSLLVWNISGLSQEKLEIGGAIIIGNSEDPSPSPGKIEYNPSTSDFEGYNGIGRKSLVKSARLTDSGMVRDIDRNQYLTVTIGTQTWMRENLRTSRYRNGEPIQEVVLNSDWVALTSGAWSWYDHDPEKDMLYGKLYNWYAVNDARSLCPTGWHVPSDAEWTTLTDLLGGLSVAGGKMKSSGTIEANTGYWIDPNAGATNESGFSGLPSGSRTSGSAAIGYVNYWWSSTQSDENQAWFRALFYNNTSVNRNSLSKSYGISVRCLKD